MRLVDVVGKRSLGRLYLHHLRSAYFVEVSETSLKAIEASLADPNPQLPGASLVSRLRGRGLVVEGDAAPIEIREGSDLVSVELEPAGRCNLACKHCFVEFSGKQMSEATFARVLDGARKLGAVEVAVNGGEPLMNPHTLDFLDRLTAARLRTVLFTNGTLVTEDAAARIAEAGVARVVVSVDGFEPAHDAVRGKGNFARTVAGIRRLVARRVNVLTTTLIRPENEAEIDRLKQWCLEDLGVAGVRFSTVAPFGRARNATELLLSDHRFRAVYADEKPKNVTPESAPGLLPCRAGVDKLFVTASGDVHGCHLFDVVAPPLGSLQQDPLEAIYAEVAERSYGKLLRKFDVEALLLCQLCPHLAECRGGCRARAWRIAGDRNAPDPVSCRKYGVNPELWPALAK